ncbi:hypothetical protein RFI_39949 [Reticulomyxa filosa]|uniref:Uncharacterized protein n=1 Tax=Reticulomyxa filosa TaxID=46433 RepID=X6L855_RETFI|nr:hypothetical protein RFI_39949 [Reticulomyxa filosa]|eukprot:ETN97578.1 hypothetical protein RFI_39949 [Reticulomyxa filosa]
MGCGAFKGTKTGKEEEQDKEQAQEKVKLNQMATNVEEIPEDVPENLNQQPCAKIEVRFDVFTNNRTYKKLYIIDLFGNRNEDDSVNPQKTLGPFEGVSEAKQIENSKSHSTLKVGIVTTTQNEVELSNEEACWSEDENKSTKEIWDEINALVVNSPGADNSDAKSFHHCTSTQNNETMPYHKSNTQNPSQLTEKENNSLDSKKEVLFSAEDEQLMNEIIKMDL